MKKNLKKLALITATMVLLISGCAKSDSVKKEETVYEADVVVVGGGGTGLVAALSAAEEGASVILIEKQGVYGGAMAMSSGKIPAFDTEEQQAEGIKDTEADMLRDIYRSGGYTQNRELLEEAVSQSTTIKNWLGDYGVNWLLETNMIYYGQTEYRIHVAEDGGPGITEKLVEAVEKNDNIVAIRNTAATALLTNDKGEVAGVEADQKGKKLQLKAKSVVLGTSGFAANREMIDKYIPSIKEAVINVAPGATGEGIEWGQKLGAGVSSMSAYQAYAPISAETNDSLGAGFLNNGGILLNKEGNRFIDEYIGYSPLGTAIANQTDGVAYMIWDESVQTLKLPALDKLTETELLKGGSVAELADKMGLTKEKVEKELTLYQEGIEKGEDYMNRTKLPKEFVGPYYAVKVGADFRHTQGGLTVDAKTAQVTKDEDNQGIPNLYAGGGVIEGFSSSGDANYMAGNGLLQAFVFGHTAGKSAAQNVGSEHVKEFAKTKKELQESSTASKDVTKSDDEYKDGVYQGKAKGEHSDIEVKVTVKEGKISEVEVLSQDESKAISDEAITQIPESIVNANSTDVEIVSGASATSNGIIDAVEDALKDNKK